MKRIPPVLAAGAVTLALVAAGCGGGGGTLSEADYSAKVSSVGSTLGQSFDDLSAEADSIGSGEVTTGAELTNLTQGLADAAQKGIDALNGAADELESTDPPDNAQAANDQLVDGLRALAGDFQELVDALESGDLAQVLDIGSTLQDVASSDAGAAIQTAIEDLKALGYDVESEG